MSTPQHTSVPPPDRTLHLPSQVYLDRLVTKAKSLGVDLQKSEIAELWFYYPPERAIAIWEPDLYQMPLGFLLTVLAHEIGHVIDFDADPSLAALTRDLHFTQVPMDIEVSGFVTGYRVIREAGIPLSVEEYVFFIQEPLASHVRTILTAGWLTLAPEDAGEIACVEELAS